MNDVHELRKLLFEQLRSVKNCNPEELDKEIERASSMVQVAESIIDSARIETERLKVVRNLESETGFLELENKDRDDNDQEKGQPFFNPNERKNWLLDDDKK